MNKISKREKIMLAVLLVLIVGCVYYLFFLTPNLEKQASLKEEITAMDDQVIMAQARVNHLNKMKKDLKAIKEENKDIKEVPAFDNSKKLMNSLKLAAIVVHVADARTCVLHPASTTHRQLTDEQLVAGGIVPEMVRFSVGIEDVEDIIADLTQALEQI